MFKNKIIIAGFLFLLSHYAHTFVLLTASVDDVRQFMRKFISDSMMNNIVSFMSSIGNVEDKDHQIELLFNAHGEEGGASVKKSDSSQLRLDIEPRTTQEELTEKGEPITFTTAHVKNHKRHQHKFLLPETESPSHSTRQMNADHETSTEESKESTRLPKLRHSKTMNTSIMDDLNRVMNGGIKKKNENVDIIYTSQYKYYKSDGEGRSVPPIVDVKPPELRDNLEQYEKKWEQTTRRHHGIEKDIADVISIEIAVQAPKNYKRPSEHTDKKGFILDNSKRELKRGKHKYYRMYTDIARASTGGITALLPIPLSTTPFDVSPYPDVELDEGYDEKEPSHNRKPLSRKKQGFNDHTIELLTVKSGIFFEEETPNDVKSTTISTDEDTFDIDKQFIFNKALLYRDTQARAFDPISTPKAAYSPKRYNGFNIDAIKVKHEQESTVLDKSKSITQATSGPKEFPVAAVQKRSGDAWWDSEVPKQKAEVQVAAVNIKQVARNSGNVFTEESTRDNLTVSTSETPVIGIDVVQAKRSV